MKKKIGLLLLMIFSILLIGCGKNMTAKEAVRDYLEMYVTLDDKVVKQIDEYVDKEEFSDDQKKVYKEILKKQYTSMTYTLGNETYDGDTAYVKANVRVMDLYKIQKEALSYFDEHKDEFNDDKGDYDKNKFLDYKLSQMKEATETTTYEIEFKVIKNGNDWEVSQLSNDDLEKIHGIYNNDK